MPVHLLNIRLFPHILRQCFSGIVQGPPVPESPGLPAEMQILGPFSRSTEPECPVAAVDSGFSKGPLGGPHNHCGAKTTAQGVVPGPSSPSSSLKGS